MGRIKTKKIKRMTLKLMKEAEFTSDFTQNKDIFKSIAVTPSKKIRNIISGYAARLARRKAEKTV
jgi:ribosomal protein S17E